MLSLVTSEPAPRASLTTGSQLTLLRGGETAPQQETHRATQRNPAIGTAPMMFGLVGVLLVPVLTHFATPSRAWAWALAWMPAVVATYLCCRRLELKSASLPATAVAGLVYLGLIEVGMALFGTSTGSVLAIGTVWVTGRVATSFHARFGDDLRGVWMTSAATTFASLLVVGAAIVVGPSFPA